MRKEGWTGRTTHPLAFHPMTTTNEIPNALPPFEVVDALIKMRANADTLIEHRGSQEIWAFDVVMDLTPCPLQQSVAL